MIALTEEDIEGLKMAQRALWLWPLIIFVVLCIFKRGMRHKVKISIYVGLIYPNWVACSFMGTNTHDFLTLFIGCQVVQALFLWLASEAIIFFAIASKLLDEDEYNKRN